MDLVNVKTINLNDAIKKVESEIPFEELKVHFWRNEYCREEGIADLYTHESDALSDLIYEVKKLIDRDGFACVEILSVDECGEEDSVYLYDGKVEKIVVFN